MPNDPEVKGDHRKIDILFCNESEILSLYESEDLGYEYICWKTGTRPEDGVRYTAFSSFVARKQFASAFNLTMDEVMARKTS